MIVGGVQGYPRNASGAVAARNDQGFSLKPASDGMAFPDNPGLSAPTQTASNLIRRGREFLMRAVESAPLKQDPVAAMKVLENRGLDQSFLADAKRQLRENGKIKIGIIDNFNVAETSHGENVARRVIASAPEYLRKHIEIVRYDVSGDKEGSAFADAAQAARNGGIVALSVSGGVRAVSADGLRKDLAPEGLDSPRAFWLALQRFEKDPERELNMQNLSLAGQRIPVVTPIWNNGFTTEAALLRNTIVTSIEKKAGSHRTEAPELVEIEVNPIPGSGHTSQSAPILIGTLLQNISKREVDAIMRERGRR